MEGNCHNDWPQDDASSIEILSESRDSRNSEWSIYSPGRSSFSGSEMSLMDFQRLSIHSTTATTVHQDGRQFIERRDLDDGGLPYSAEFYLNGEVWKLSGEDCFLMSPRRYIAEVTIEGAVDMMQADGFEEAVRTLLKHLKVEKVLLDKQLEECNKTKSDLTITLDKLTDETGENIDRKRDVMLLRMMLRKHGNSLNIDFMHDLRKCSSLSSDIMSSIDNYVTKVLKLIQRNEILGHLNDCSLSDEFINDATQKALNQHRARLTAICPSSMKDKLSELSDDCILYVTMDEMHLFSDLMTLDGAIFEAALPMIFFKFLTGVQKINDEQFADLGQQSSRIFLSVCKSLQEIAEQLGAHIKTGNTIIEYSEAFGWKVTNQEKEFQSSYLKCLRQQLHMLAKLANHFEPGGPFRTSHFPYEFTLFQNMDAIPEPVRIWLCLLDDSMKDLAQADHDKMHMLSCFFKSYVSFMASEGIRSETLECLRSITHDALRSLANGASSQHNLNTPGSDLLEYIKMISYCVGKFQRKHFANDCDQIEATLQQIICNIMDMNVSSDEASKFFNVFKQLLNDLSALQVEWFIQLDPSEKRSLLLRSLFVVPVNSIWKDTEYECFKVVDLDGFVEMYKVLYNTEEIPMHYQLQVIQALLENLEKLISKQHWKNENRVPDLLDALIAMINSIRSSLVLLKDQPEYCCFEEFLLKMSKPNAQAISEKVQEFSYTDATNSEETFNLWLDRFSDCSKEHLKNSLKIFTTQFNKYILESAQLSREKRIKKIVSDVRSKIEPELATCWTEEFKGNALPEILAGLSAVWSIIVSGNNSSWEKMTKPSHLQISCVLNIFSDQEDYSRQLFHLSNQQGKEIVLGITAALLALHGNKVQIVCFNRHLTRINSLDWIKVFRSFAIFSNISYESLDDVAYKWSKGWYEKYTAYIKECLGFEAKANHESDPKDASGDERSVLLIEDIDILLQKDTYCMPYKRFVNITIPGLEAVQRKLFCKSKPVEGSEIDHYIKYSDNPDIRELRSFLNRANSYKILAKFSMDEVEYTNKTLFLKHLDDMKHSKTLEDYYSYRGGMPGSNKCGYLPLGELSFPYEHLLASFQFIVGFTCAPLDLDETRFLALRYGFHRQIPYAFVHPTIPTKFDSEQDFLYVASVDNRDWMEAIIIAIKASVDKNCLVLVFFKGTQDLEQLKQTQYVKQLNATAIRPVSNGEDLSVENDPSEEISVLMVCEGHFSKGRQVHVIQTFFSDTPKEEVLIRRQAEQGHTNGSYELIIPTKRYMSKGLYNTADAKDEEITYKWLEGMRFYLTVDEIWISVDHIKEKYEKTRKFLNYIVS